MPSKRRLQETQDPSLPKRKHLVYPRELSKEERLYQTCWIADGLQNGWSPAYITQGLYTKVLVWIAYA